MTMTVQIAWGTAPILSSLPAPPAGDRWVGPLPPVTEAHPERPDEDGWATTPQGGERTHCYTPVEQSSGVTTDSSERACVRTDEGWWVAVPADRPSWLATQVAGAGGTHEAGPHYRGPIREGHPLAWRDRPDPVGAWRGRPGWVGAVGACRGRPGWVGAGGRWTRPWVRPNEWSQQVPGPWQYEGASVGGRLPPAAVELARSWGIDPRMVRVTS